MKLSEAMVACMGVPQIQTTIATPMRSSEVKSNTTWESLQTAGADCCFPLGLMSTLISRSGENLTFKCCVVWLRLIAASSWFSSVASKYYNVISQEVLPHGAKMVHEKIKNELKCKVSSLHD